MSMSVGPTMADPDLVARVRELGRQRALSTRPGAVARARQALAGVVDVGNLTDDDVLQLVAAYRAGQADAGNGGSGVVTPI